MGYIIQSFLGKQEDLLLIQNAFDKAVIKELGQDLFMIPMTEELFDQINNYQWSEDISSFMYLNKNVEEKILKLIGKRSIGYIEADYFGGEGSQIGILWKDGIRYKLIESRNAVNIILNRFNIITIPGKDEFDTLNLSRYRTTRDWAGS